MADACRVKHAFALDAVVQLGPGGDERAPGGAVSLALCGSWEHEGPCPVAPHRTTAERTGQVVALRVLYACSPEAEPDVRATIIAALAGARLDHPEARSTTWELSSCVPGDILPGEHDLAERLVRQAPGSS